MLNIIQHVRKKSNFLMKKLQKKDEEIIRLKNEKEKKMKNIYIIY